MWKVGGIKIESAAGRQKKNASGDGISWKREIFCKSLRTRKFSMGKFFGASTHGIVTHSGFIKCIWKVGTTNFWPCFACLKLGDAGRTRVASKIRAVLEKASRSLFWLKSKILIAHKFLEHLRVCHAFVLCALIYFIIDWHLDHRSFEAVIFGDSKVVTLLLQFPITLPDFVAPTLSYQIFKRPLGLYQQYMSNIAGTAKVALN